MQTKNNPAIKEVFHNGYRVVQVQGNFHISIYKDEQMVFHIPCAELKTDEELKKVVDTCSTLFSQESVDAYLTARGLKNYTPRYGFTVIERDKKN